MGDWLRLVRAHNLLLAAAGVVAGGWIALGHVFMSQALALAALSGAALGAAGNILNDLADVAADRANPAAATRPLAAGRLARGATWVAAGVAGAIGVAAAGLVSGPQLAAGAVALGVMTVYSPLLKRHGPPGTLAVAAVAGLPPWYGALAVDRPAAGLVPWVLGAWLHAVREMVKDLEDEPGDRAAGRRTLPVRLGPMAAGRVAAVLAFLFVPLAAVLPLVGGWGSSYLIVAAAAQVAVLAVSIALWRGPFPGASRLLKLAMAIGLVALVLGRLFP